MMTVHFAFCVCVLLVLKPLQAFRGNQEFHVEPGSLAEFQAATLQPDSSKAKKMEELEKQLAELKLADDRKAKKSEEVEKQLAELKLQDDRKAKEITNLTEEVKLMSERMDVLEGLTNPVEQMAQKLTESFRSTSDEEAFWKSYDVTSLCQASQNALCKKKPERFKEALKDPCMKPGCSDKDTSDKGSCRNEKEYFLRWSEVFCMHLHRDKGSDPVLDCMEGAMHLLNSTDGSKYSSREWAKAPAGKESVIFWSRIPEGMPFSKIAQIPRGFLLSSTLLGALTRMPKVGDLEKCTWSCQKEMWASNSKGLVNQMPKLKPEYFITGMNVLEEVGRPFTGTVAFRIELPALAKAHSKLGELHVASLNPKTSCDDLTMVTKMSFGSGLQSKVDLRCAVCHHCMAPDSSDSCVADCITGANAVPKRLTVKDLLLKDGRAPKAVKVGLATIEDLMADWNFTREEVLQAGFSAAKLKESGFKAAELREAGFTAKDLKEGGFTAEALKKGGFTAKALKEAGFTAEALKEAGFTAEALKKGGFTAKALREAGFTAKALKEAGFTAKALKEAGFTAEALKEARFTAEALNEGGFTLEALKEAGFTAEALTEVGFTLEALKKAGFTVEALRRGGFTRKQILKVVEHYQEAFDTVYGMPMEEALDLLQETQNEHLKQLRSDLGHLRDEGVQTVTAGVQSCKRVQAWLSFSCNALHVAAKLGLLDFAEALIRKGANVNAKGEDGETPLHWAAMEGHDKVVELLLRKGADVKAKTKNGETPLFWAARNGHDKVVELLLRKGADLEAKEKDGWTPLHLAAWKGHDKVVELLLWKGADVNAKNKYGKTSPLYLAAKYRHDKVVRLLKAAGARQ